MKSFSFWRSLFLSALAVAALGACSDDDDKGDFDAVIKVNDKKTETVGIVAAGGETQAVAVTSAGPWTLAFEADQEWCFPNVTSGKGGTTELVFSVDPMPAGVEERSATAVLSAPGRIFEVEYTVQVRVTVRQSESGSTIPDTNVAQVRELLKAMNPTSTAAAVTETLAAMTLTGVVGSESSGVNLGNQRNFAIQDENRAPNSGLTISCSSNITLSAGQVVSIPLTGAQVSLYSGALQLSVDNTAVQTVATTDAPQPVIVVPSALADYESMLVQIDDCYPTAGYGTAWNNTTNNGNINFITAAGETFVCRVGAQCTFKNELIPEKSGSLAGIVAQYNGTMQVSPRTAADIKLTADIPAPEFLPVTIGQIDKAGNYKVENATVIATYKEGFLMQDATGVILVYVGKNATVPAAAKTVTVEGAVSAYGGVLQFGEGATVTETGTGTLPTPPQPVEITADNIAGYMTAPKVTYVKATGTLAISGNYTNFNFTFSSEYTGSVSAPNDDLGFPALNGKLIDIVGWFVNNGNAGGTGKYFTIVATGVEENKTTPVLSFTSTPKAFAGSSPVAQTINFTSQNIPTGQNVDFSFDGADKDKFTVTASDATSVTINAVGDNASGAPYTATLVAKLGTTVLAELTVTQDVKLADGVKSVEFDLTSGWDNAQVVTSITLPDVPVSIALSKGTGSTDPAWYTTGTGIRTYTNNTITFSGATITQIEFTFAGASYNKIKADEGYTEATSTWTGEATSVVFTGTGTSRIQKIKVTYKE